MRDSVAPTRHDYREQAARYDRTRGASPSILAPLLQALDDAPGPRLLDVCGGTGNYAAALRARGWDPVVLDVSAEMLAYARAKGFPSVRADASTLPIADASVDAVTLVSALHLVRDWRRALAEARRALRRGGRLTLMVYAREHLDVHWILEYFPTARRWADEEHQTLDELTAELPGATVHRFEFEDLVDASMAALCRRPHLLLDPGWRLQTSFFERLAESDPAGHDAGLARLQADLEAGRRPDIEAAAVRRRYGDGCVIAWTAP